MHLLYYSSWRWSKIAHVFFWFGSPWIPNSLFVLFLDDILISSNFSHLSCSFFNVDFMRRELDACVIGLERRWFVKMICLISCSIDLTKVSKIIVQNSSIVLLRKSTYRIKQPKNLKIFVALRVSHFHSWQQISCIDWQYLVCNWITK